MLGIIDHLRLAIGTLASNPLRSLLTLLGIIIGAVADEFVLAHPVGHPHAGAALAVLGSAGLYLLGNLLEEVLSPDQYQANFVAKERSREAYDGIEKGMVTIERQLMPAKPDVDATTATITEVMTQYNKIVTQITREARDAQGAK